jgi:negative regulator of flagellin synthesis FlgM
MKINDLTHNISKIANLETTANRQKDEESNAGQATGSTAQAAERVELSNMSVEYSNAAEKMEVAPVERIEKIEKLRMQVQNGSYNIDSAKIADKIVKDTLFNVSE